ncbi:NAD-dependent succinate-semialdehyde dehydrogenase [Actinophytocola oryzae]|uniref:Succinate-semialdehyde dehydrogenase/glutarate-semialdehyde dehydrogenase n=1 Tax=Actinophytocola oryzae TaxID=502181 RepID=A0A4R7VL24_9PSEU|nr:NAD-dependent succinate-semialdehyde dehydrogenase [Actinophytocola oryzae]TDV49975.1 succinate-semialdehyde dehydrogenase/glutarate-semialdehyde dehydrogenase [Actinophytocola oryzae]
MPVSVNPATEAWLAEYDSHKPEQVADIVAAAAAAQRGWRATPLERRLALLTAIAAELRSDVDRFARLITSEMGKPVTEARAEIEKCAWTLDHYAEHGTRYLAAEPVVSGAARSEVVLEPLGVLLAIMPWNFPFWQYFRFLAPALAAGNGAILKHAANVSGCALVLEEVVRRAGAPEGLCATVLVESTAVADLIADDRVAAVTFTGSTEVGAIVAAQAGAALKKHVLELGGSDPFIVLRDAPLARAATAAVRSRFTNSGQSCVNAKRFLVDEAVADEFVDLVVREAGALVVGDPLDETTEIGPLARRDLRDVLHDQVLRSVADGAVPRLGGHPGDGPGFFYPPTVLDHVTPRMAAFAEETFGPVASITRVRDAEEAVALANRTEYGLGAALWTEDPALARRLVPLIDAGAVFVNGVVASDPRLPFGGIKKSGYGRELGGYGLKEFVNVKTVWIGELS